MAGRWLRKIRRAGGASRKARDAELAAMTLKRAVAIMEALLSTPARKPRKKRRHPVSLSRRRRRRKRKGRE